MKRFIQKFYLWKFKTLWGITNHDPLHATLPKTLMLLALGVGNKHNEKC